MTMLSAPAFTSRRFVAPTIDLVCLVAFVLAGAGQHDVDQGLGWFLTVLWPLVVAWYGLAIVMRLYSSADRMWIRLAVTLVAGALLNAVLRWAFTNRPFLSVYTAVFIAWMVLTAFGWRAIVQFRGTRRARLRSVS